MPSSPQAGDDSRVANATGDAARSQSWLAGLRIVSLCTLLSRMLGLVRDIGMAMLFGNGAIMDVFSVAYRIPNLARRIFGEGALTAAFLPVFVREHEQVGDESAWRLASSVFTTLAAVLCAVVLLGELALWGLYEFGGFGVETRLLISLTALMLPYLFLICLAAQVSAVLHALGHFTWPALLPVILNVVWIAGMWWVIPGLDTPEAQITAVGGCVILGGCLQLVAPVPQMYRMGFRFQPDWSQTRTKVRAIGRAMLPIVLGLSITQINTLADSLIAWGFSAPEDGGPSDLLFGRFDYPLDAGTASALYFGQRMYQFPLGVFGTALGTVLFPLLARHAQEGRLDLVRATLSRGLRMVICIGLPASVGLMLLARPLTMLLFRHGAFDTDDAEQTAMLIIAYGSAVWAYCGLLIVHRAYYAIGDHQTPLRVGLCAVCVNLILNFTLIWFLGGVGLALATAVAATGQAIAITLLIQNRIGRLNWKRIGRTAVQTVVATVAMAATCWWAAELAAQTAGDTLTGRGLKVGIPLAASILTFAAVARIIGLTEFATVLKRYSDDNE